MRWNAILLLCAPVTALAQSTDAVSDVTLDVTSPALAAPQPGGTWSSFWWGDWDGDGLADAYVIQPAGPGRLLHNCGDGHFEDLTERAGLADFRGAQMALWSDIDGDGRQDLFLLAFGGESRLLRQDARAVFVDVTASAGLELGSAPIDAAWLDYDADGRPDLALTTLGDERLFHNLGDGRFERADLGLDVLPRPRLEELEPPRSLDEARSRRDLPPVAPGPPGGGPQTAGVGIGGTPQRWTPPGTDIDALGTCAAGVLDIAVPTNCVPASSVPTLGMLYPLSFELFVDSATGFVGVGTLSPASQLDVVGGDIRTDARLVSTASSGPPLAVSSSAKVANLNADQLDGLDSSAFSQLGTSIEGGEIAAGAITNAHVAAGAAIQGSKVVPDFGMQDVETLGQLISYAAAGPPLAVGSSIRVDNLNVDFLDGLDASAFSQLGGSIEGSEITDGTIGANDLASPLTGSGLPQVLYVNATGTNGTAIRGTASAGGFSNGTGVLGTTSSEGGTGVEGIASATSAYAYGVHGLSNAPSGAGVLGEVDSLTGSTWGVAGLVNSPDGTGVHGESLAASGVNYGVYGKSNSIDGAGVFGEAEIYGVRGSAKFGLYGDSSATAGAGVYGSNSGGSGVFGLTTGVGSSGVSGSTAYDGTSFGNLSAGVHGSTPFTGSYVAGVFGETNSASAMGIYARAWSTTGSAKGILAQTDASSGDAVYGIASHTTGAAWGVRGETASAGGYGVYCSGAFAATGTKSFIQPHPEDASKEVRFVCLEGNESGTYFRGSGRVENGTALIEVPEEFRLVTSLEGLTAMVTAVGSPARLWVASKGLDAIVVHADMDTDFDYFVNGVRLGFEEHEPIQANLSYVPKYRSVEFGTQYPAALREILVQNGTLNPDFTPNELTAAENGWVLSDPPTPREGDEPVTSGPSQKPATTTALEGSSLPE